MGFCSSSAKFILFSFNLTCALIGLAVVGIGIYGYTNGTTFDYTLQTPSILLIVFGSIIFLISFLGCWGAIQEDRCLLNTYGIILFSLLLVLIAIGAWILIRKEQTKYDVAEFLATVFSNAREGDRNSRRVVDIIQSWNECCGYDGPQFWALRGVPGNLPRSCCEDQSGICTIITPHFESPCEEAVMDFLSTHIQVLGTVAIVVGCIQLLGVFFAFFLAHTIRREELRG